jgi:uncharacterized protein (TIGR03437 family)
MPADRLTLFATGDGLASQPSAAVTVTIGGVAAQILNVGPAPGRLGVTQIDVTVPVDALAATSFLLGYDLHVPVPVVRQVGGISSQPAVYNHDDLQNPIAETKQGQIRCLSPSTGLEALSAGTLSGTC